MSRANGPHMGFGTMATMTSAVKKMPAKSSAPKATAIGQVYQLRIDLRGVKPKVWRRVLVPGTMTLAQLHHVIQAAMGWRNSHLHEFIIDEQRYGDPDPGWDEEGGVISDHKVTVAKAMRGCGSARYIYDFGDDWDHKLTLEPPAARYLGMKMPVCTDGKSACPPEDCGGPYGYAHFLEAVADPKHPEHAELIEWVGRPWDAAAFSIDGANRAINRLR